MLDKYSKSISTKHGRKGTLITFNMKKKESFVNGFQKRKKERRDKSIEKKKLKDRQFRDGVKKDAKDAMKKHIKTVEKIYNSSQKDSNDGYEEESLENLEIFEKAPKVSCVNYQ
ncbi:Nucleolar protein 12 (25kDa) family protein [Cryptosporidium meleagridis]|uniref:Nucleolar protein 12 (25kDa) family protein n=1 Tax=Cryptosporidium meleagridis TaxID=93969 RepID=A0A2P4Z493_9CRYT|nr:Nucleolar protein 12 (25kDa) family protein [Cryptosporidium meleagridis]